MNKDSMTKENKQQKPSSGSQKLIDELRNFLATGEDWDRRGTSIPGISIVKLPATKSRSSSIAVEINPVVGGVPTKRRGLAIVSPAELDSTINALSDERTKVLINTIGNVTGVGKQTIREGIIEI